MRFALDYLGGLFLAVALVFAVLARKVDSPGWVRVAADDVALVSDFARGSRVVVATPGVRFFVPYFQEVELATRRPGELVFGGAEDALPALEVRAKDGTTFTFEALRLRFVLDVAQAVRAADDVGLEASARTRLVQALARGVLCDEFGRYTAEEIVVGANLDAARAAARLRLNARLAPHGVTVLEIPALTPRFDPGYEQQVLRRRVAEQQVELVRAERAKLAGELAQRREKVTREKEIEAAVLAGELASRRTAAGTRAVVTLRGRHAARRRDLCPRTRRGGTQRTGGPRGSRRIGIPSYQLRTSVSDLALVRVPPRISLPRRDGPCGVRRAC